LGNGQVKSALARLKRGLANKRTSIILHLTFGQQFAHSPG
jgi:hypothetical protein